MKTKRIQLKDVKVGMKIKTLEDGKVVFKEIIDKFDTIVPHHDQVRLEFENGVGIDCSVNHPIMVFQNGTILQKYPLELTCDDLVLTENGVTRLSTCDIHQENDQNYLDITVQDTHTFFTSNRIDGPMVLTHNSQGGIRNASATVNYPIWHYQFEDLVVLKNNQGTEETRVRHMDYCVVINALFWRRLKEQKSITFFDPNEVPDLYEAFYRNTAEFERLYVKYENTKGLRTKTQLAETVFKDMLMKERGDTGRIYLLNIDNVQNQGPFDTNEHPVYQSNLCVAPDTLIDAIIDGNQSLIRIDGLTESFNLGSSIQVKSKDLTNNEILFKNVTAAAKTDVNRKLLKITDSETGKSIRVTSNHKVWTKNRGWVEAGNLKEDDQLDFS